MLAAIGSFATKNTAVDVILMAAAGLVGFIFSTCKFNSSALILGLVLGNICESNLRRAYTMIAGDTLWASTMNILRRPITSGVMLVCVIVLVWPFLKPLLAKKKAVAK